MDGWVKRFIEGFIAMLNNDTKWVRVLVFLVPMLLLALTGATLAISLFFLLQFYF